MEAVRWDTPKERMKMRDRHIVPLATQTIETLEMFCMLPVHGEWLFPGDRGAVRTVRTTRCFRGGLNGEFVTAVPARNEGFSCAYPISSRFLGEKKVIL